MFVSIDDKIFVEILLKEAKSVVTNKKKGENHACEKEHDKDKNENQSRAKV